MAPSPPTSETPREGRRGSPPALFLLIVVSFLLPLPPAAALQTEPAGVVREALSRIQGEDFEGAIRILEEARTGPEASADLLSMLGGLYVHQGKVDKAYEILSPLALAPGADPLVLFDAGRAALALGKEEEAERHLGRSVEQAPLSRAALMLGELRAEQGRHGEAVTLYRPFTEGANGQRIAETDPPLAAEINRRLANALVAAGRSQEALAPLERLTALEPDDRDGWQSLGELLIELDRLDEAREALARSHEIGEADRQAEIEADRHREETAVPVDDLLLAAAAHQQEGRLEEALSTLRSAIEAEPNDVRPRVLEIRALISLKRLDEARPRAEFLVTKTKEDPEALYLRGMVALAERNIAEAEADLRRVVDAVPNHLAGLNGLAMALIVKGEHEEAKSLLTRVLENWPDDPLARSNLEKLR